MPPHIYVPIIKGKTNDLKAVARVSQARKALVKPMLEIVPVPPGGNVDDHLHSFAHNVLKYGPTKNLFVDFYGFLPGQTLNDGTDATIAGFKLLKATGVALTPVYGFDRDDALWAPLRAEIKKFGQGFCFRIDIDDLDDRSEETWEAIVERSAELGLLPEQIDLMIDLRYVAEINSDILKNLVIDFLAFMPAGSEYRSLIVSGSSALKDVSRIPKDGVGEVVRNELRLWMQLQADLFGFSSFIYSDYGVVHPEFTMVGPNKNANAKIRYTTKGKIKVFRGHRLADAPKYQQYQLLADHVRNSADYQGRTFSVGDQYIDDCADMNVGTGNLGTWVFVDMNHHIENTAVQIRQLAATIDASFSADAIAEAMELA